MRRITLVVGVVVVALLLGYFPVTRWYRHTHEYHPPKAILEPLESLGGHGMEISSTRRVVVAIHIGPDGQVVEDSILQSSGVNTIDSLALRQALGVRFEPAMRGGKPVDAWVSLPIKYHAEGDTSSCPRLK